jgi:hypothetical protein
MRLYGVVFSYAQGNFTFANVENSSNACQDLLFNCEWLLTTKVITTFRKLTTVTSVLRTVKSRKNFVQVCSCTCFRSKKGDSTARVGRLRNSGDIRTHTKTQIYLEQKDLSHSYSNEQGKKHGNCVMLCIDFFCVS